MTQRILFRSAALLIALTLPTAVLAEALQLPSPVSRTALLQNPLGSYALPITAFDQGVVRTIATEGAITQSAWKLPQSTATTLQILNPLRDQLRDGGYNILFECDTDSCGGFDFRYGIDLLPEPDMHVNLGDFRFLSARKYEPTGTLFLSLMISRSATAAYVQQTQVDSAALRPEETAPQTTAPLTTLSTDRDGEDFSSQLEAQGHVVLEDLVFETGSADLGLGPFESLTALAAYLTANPTRAVALVGHTDAEGALEGNVALSKRRAASVAARLVAELGVSGDQIRAEGMGYLAPRATNLTDAGRTQNRRVEVILTSTQ